MHLDQRFKILADFLNKYIKRIVGSPGTELEFAL